MQKFVGFEKGINLGGWFSQYDCTDEHIATYITENDIKQIADCGIDHVRVPVDYNVFETDDGEYKEKGFKQLEQALDICRKNKVNMIIDLHKTAGYSYEKTYNEAGFFDSESLQERFYKLWEEFAKRFGKYSDCVAFELLNEINDKEVCEKWNMISNTCVRRIRKYAPDNYIVIGGYWNNSVDAIADIALPYDKKIVYTFHCYDPFIFTHQAAYWVDEMPKNFRISYPGDINEYRIKIKELKLDHIQDYLNVSANGFDVSYFEKHFLQAVKICEERGVALFCGEYGVINLAQPESVLNWYKDINAAFRKLGIARCAWSYKQVDYGISDSYSTEMVNELIKFL